MNPELLAKLFGDVFAVVLWLKKSNLPFSFFHESFVKNGWKSLLQNWSLEAALMVEFLNSLNVWIVWIV